MKNAILIILSFLLISCSSRKVQKSKEKEDTKIENKISESTIDKTEKSESKQNETMITDKSELDSKETVYEPIDNSKPIVIVDSTGKKTELYNVRKITRNNIVRNNIVIDKKDKDSIYTKNDIDYKKSELNKEEKSTIKKEKPTERKGVPSWLIILSVIVISIIAFIYYRFIKI